MATTNNQSIQQIKTTAPSAAPREAHHPDGIAANMEKLAGLIGTSQIQVITHAVKGDEGQFFAGKLEELCNIVESMPRTYETDGQRDEAVAWLHYFKNGHDWWLTELDMLSGHTQDFGLADLGFGDGPELGYISIAEIIKLGAELDLHFEPRSLREIKQKHAVDSLMSDVNYVGHPMHY